MSGLGETYKCELCGGEFEKEWSDEEARAEALETFTEEELEDGGIVCDECYKSFMVWYKGEK